MANRYWVGGTASWTSTNTSVWSTSSGGSGGASVPTSVDNAIFDQASTYTVTLADATDCLDFTVSAGTVTFAGTGVRYIYGSMSLVSGTVWSATNGMSFRGTGSGTKTITTNGTTINSPLSFLNIGSTWQLGSALTVNSITVSLGTFNTNNYALTCTSGSPNISMTGGTLGLGSSTITLQGVNALSISGGALNSGTSTITCSNTNSTLTFAGSNRTFYNVSFSGTTGNTVSLTAGTIQSLTVSAPSGAQMKTISLSSNIVITSSFTGSGNGGYRRIFYCSNIVGTTRTITLPSTTTLTDVDFRDITAGAFSINTTRGGDCGGNTNISFPTAKTVYRVGTDTTWAGTSSWATSSGGTGNNINFPIAQDTAVIDNATTGSSLTTSNYNVGTVDASNRTDAFSWAIGGNSCSRYGSLILGSGISVSGAFNQTFLGRGTQTITCAGKTLTFSIIIQKPSGALELGDAYLASGTITLSLGAFNAKNYNVTCTAFSSFFNVRTLTMGSGLWTLTGQGGVWSLEPTGLTYNKDTANILLSNTTTAARIFSGYALSYNKVTIGGATGTSTLTFDTSDTVIAELESTKTVAHTISIGANMTINKWSVSGSVGKVVSLVSSVSGTARSISMTEPTSNINYLSVKDISITQPDLFYVGANSTNLGNNTNVYFTTVSVSAGNFFIFFN